MKDGAVVSPDGANNKEGEGMGISSILATVMATFCAITSAPGQDGGYFSLCPDEMVMIDTDCLTGVISSPDKDSDGVISASGAHVQSHCGGNLNGVKITFTSGDGETWSMEADNVGPTEHITLAAFDTASPGSGMAADSWSITVDMGYGEDNPAFSGDF